MATAELASSGYSLVCDAARRYGPRPWTFALNRLTTMKQSSISTGAHSAITEGWWPGLVDALRPDDPAALSLVAEDIGQLMVEAAPTEPDGVEPPLPQQQRSSLVVLARGGRSGGSNRPPHW